jgi:hypothetical protein
MAVNRNHESKTQERARRPGTWLARLALTTGAAGGLLLALTSGLEAQDAGVIATLEVTPHEIQMGVGEHTSVEVRALNALGEEVEAEFRFAAPRGAVQVADGVVLGIEPGEYEVIVDVFPTPEVQWEGDDPPSVVLPVRIGWPSLASVEVSAETGTLYEGTMVRHHARAIHDDGSERPSSHAAVRWSSSNPDVATVNSFGQVRAVGTGAVEIRAQVDGVTGAASYQVEAFPAERLEILTDVDQARTGDVIPVQARALDAQGNEIDDLPITLSHTFIPADSVGHHSGGSGLIRDGQFVGELPGEYTILASAGRVSAHHTIQVEHRGVIEPVEFRGQGRVGDQHTSDLWVWEGVDGRDYAITGTWGSGGWALIWDVTDPTNIVKTDSVQVDARTVNDVKVSPDGRYASMTREGASDRRNGVVILDLADPAHPVIAAEFDEDLAGGVHNAFPTNDYLFALSGGEKYVIIDVSDIYNPRRVSQFQYPGARIHDVWVKDGIAYSAQRPYGGIMVDVGDGRWGGSPENPVFISKTGATPEGGGAHTVYPYYQESTGRMLLFLADEILSREGQALGEGMGRTLVTDPYDPETGEGGQPSMSSGYMHIWDVTDHENPKMIARYHVPEAGTHNTWVEDDVLYQGYWEGGMRVVDVSGDLLGNIYTQNREIAVFKSQDPAGYIANAPFVWSAMPHKGHVFFSDFNSGLWAVEVTPQDAVIP